ncbi:MAG TPA: ADYC domain-containing protein, partial [Kofleriaceae bacterium]
YTSDAKTFDLYGMLTNEAVVYEGDRFDTALKTMSLTADNTWFSFGCAGHALAKLYITRNTVNTQPQPDWALRQSVFKMFVGDYCGARNNVGETFTLTGEPIAWKGGLQTDFAIEATLTTNEPPLDARWDEAGATCLYEPRMQISSNPQAPTLFPNAMKQILDACPTLPICTNTDPHAFDGARVVSANRVPI